MNPIALELNQQLEGTTALRLLSELGKHMYFPRGIVSQAAEAGTRATRFDATIGMAVEHRKPMALPSVSEQVPGLSQRELVAYTPTGGIPGLRESWKSQIRTKNPSLGADDFSLPMVVPGLTNGIFHSSELFIDAGDAVIAPELRWDNYDLIVEVRRGASIRSFPLFSDTGGFNLKGLDTAIRQAFHDEKRSKIVLILNFPNNPSGYSPSRAEAEGLRSLLVSYADQGLDILAICDDAYFGLFYEADTFTESLFALLSQAHTRILAIKVDGPTKEDFVWGMRLGFISFGGKGLKAGHYAALQSKLMGSVRASVSSSSSVGQYVLRNAYAADGYDHQKERAFQNLERRYRKVRSIVETYMSGSDALPLRALPFNSGYFMTFVCQGLSAEALRVALLDRGVGTIALQDRYLRIAYSAVDEGDLEALFGEIFETARMLGK